MKSILLALLVGFTRTISAEPGDAALIQGTWQIVSSKESFGELKPEQLAGMKLIIGAGQLQFKKDNQDAMVLRYTIQPGKAPKRMDTVHEIDPGKPIIQLAIYSLEGNTLKLCLAAAGKERPADFEIKPGDSSHFFVMKRIEGR